MDGLASTPPSTKQATTEPVNESTHSVPDSGRDGRMEDGPDVFEKHVPADSTAAEERQGDEGFVLSRSVQDPSEELPIELISLTDR